MTVAAAAGVVFDARVPLLIVGAGCAGLVAALAACDDGGADQLLVLERDPRPAGSTALSSGFIPAAGTRWQRAAGVDDRAADMAADIHHKNLGRADPRIVERLCRDAAPALHWLHDRHGLAFTLVQGFLYPGHRVARMHALPARTGAALIQALQRAAEDAGVTVATEARVCGLYADGRRVRGVRVRRPDGGEERLGCDALILACNGYGGDPALLARYIPEMCQALYFGHPGNTGDALRWGQALGAATADLGAYQGHGSVAVPQQVLITWALMMNGGIQVNRDGERFSNEHAGYSEQAVAVLAQPGGVAWSVYDHRLHQQGLGFDDYRRAVELGAVCDAADAASLAARLGLPPAALAASIADTGRSGRDRFGRELNATPALESPYYAVKVTGALFHTQGGLCVDGDARVLGEDGAPLPNLFAAGGAARGVSGPTVDGYLSGNGLLSALCLGRAAGAAAARRR